MTIVYQRTYFGDLNGTPLDGGKVYVGVVNQDPETNPVNCFWDTALTVPATQPLATSQGYIVRNGARSAVYIAEATYSQRVRNRANVEVDYIADAYPELPNYVTLTGTQTLTNKKFGNSTDFYNGRFTFSSEASPLSPRVATLDVRNNDDAGVGLHVRAYWTGTTAAPYTNNDVILTETYNSTLSNSLNRSWGASLSNAYHNVPVGVTDTGTRVGVLGWAPSVPGQTGFVHAGTIEEMSGVMGTSGFQGSGTPTTAVINAARGVAGLIYTDSLGATIQTAQAGIFVSDGKGLDGTPATASTIVNNYAIYARAQNGTTLNYSFYGELGTFYNFGNVICDSQIQANSTLTQSGSAIASRVAGNSLEFGYPDNSGFGSNIGATQSSGLPFMAFCAEADPTGDTFRTRGKKGVVVSTNLAGDLIFSRVTTASASGQSLTETLRLSASGYMVFPIGNVGNYANDAAAAAGGVPVGGVYRNASVMMIRVT